jgi:hypothetical protein
MGHEGKRRVAHLTPRHVADQLLELYLAPGHPIVR